MARSRRLPSKSRQARCQGCRLSMHSSLLHGLPSSAAHLLDLACATTRTGAACSVLHRCCACEVCDERVQGHDVEAANASCSAARRRDGAAGNLAALPSASCEVLTKSCFLSCELVDWPRLRQGWAAREGTGKVRRRRTTHVVYVNAARGGGRAGGVQSAVALSSTLLISRAPPANGRCAPSNRRTPNVTVRCAVKWCPGAGWQARVLAPGGAAAVSGRL